MVSCSVCAWPAEGLRVAVSLTHVVENRRFFEEEVGTCRRFLSVVLSGYKAFA